MFSNSQSFVDLCLRGEVLADEIDDFVDRWHESETESPLHEFLGLTHDEYALWVERPDSLKFVLNARKHNYPLADFHGGSGSYNLAARSVPSEDVEALIDWLRTTGRIHD